MKMKDAIKIAKEVASDAATVKSHYGANKRRDRAVRILHCDANTASRVAGEIAQEINGEARVDAGFAAVWF